jgi:hypothetical protein
MPIHGKEGSVPESMPAILESMDLEVAQCVDSVRRYGGLSTGWREN